MTFIAASSPSVDDITPGVLGFLVVAGIAVALVFLLLSMNKQFRKLPPPEDGAGAPRGAAGSAEGAQAADGAGASAGAEAKQNLPRSPPVPGPAGG
ncbi:MAG: hypothetical protein JOY82_21090 [Streptosporangiaceae bacterium]|nr:hypothetical protein [Streptosporangiaceae bacterium]MBV9856979.1 hypothetical protein [Streptosporangiaceae bacterium]